MLFLRWFPREIDTKESHLFQLRYVVCVVIRVEAPEFYCFSLLFSAFHGFVRMRLTVGCHILFSETHLLPLPSLPRNYLQLLQVHNFQHSLVLLLVFCCFFRQFFACCICILNFLFVWQLFQIVICYCLEFILLPCLGNVRLPHVPHVPPAPPPTLPPTIEGRWSACAEIIHTRDLQSHNLIPYLLG